MGRRVTVTRWASLELRRRGMVAWVRRITSGSWPTYTAPVYGELVLDLPAGIEPPGAALAVDVHGRAVIYHFADDDAGVAVIRRETKELAFQ